MTQQLSKSSKSLRFCVPCTFYSTDCSRPARCTSVRKGRSRAKNRGIAAARLAILPRSGKFFAKARGKRHFKRKKEQGRRNKAEGRNANFLPLHPSICSSSTQAVAFSIEPSFKNRQGLYNSRSARRC